MRDLRPFPTVKTYLAWARDHGCTVEIADLPGAGVSRYQRAVITNLDASRSVTEIFIEVADVLMSTTVARLDRRLGLKSHLFT